MDAKTERLHYIDNLRVFLTVLVIAHHCAGAWTIGNSPVQDTSTDLLLNIFCGINASFFMGAFFLVSGYFHPPALRKKGTRLFILDRFQRLALPAMVYACTVMPVMRYLLYYHVQDHGPAPGFIAALPQYFWGGFGFGHLWFVVMLFIFGVAYALLAGGRRMEGDAKGRAGPGGTRLQRRLVALTLVLIAGTFIVRIWFPQNTWVEFPWPIAFEPAHLPQYVLMFAVGVYAFNAGLLQQITPRIGLAWTALALVPTLVFTPMFMVDSFLGSGLTMAGGISALREAFMCIGVSVGLLALFKQKFNQSGRLLRYLSRNAYAAYIVHLPLVYALQYAVIPWDVGPVAKFLAVAVTAVPISFLLSGILTRLPGVRAVL